MILFSSKFKLLCKKIILIAIALGLFFAVSNKFVKENIFSISKKISEEEVPSRIPSINISIPEKDYDFLFSDLPLSNRTFQKGKALVDGQPDEYNISLRLRGDHGWHWYKEKPSFRIRINGEKKLYQRKEIDYINPEDPSGFSNVMSSIMATKVELPHFLMTFSQVWINNDYKGLYLIADRKLSSNLIYFDGVTGPVVTGDAWDLKIWFDEKAWQYEQGIENVSLEELQTKMKDLIRHINNPYDRQIEASIDIEKTAKWAAFMATIGSIHSDDFHNNYFVYDLSRKLYFPVISDPTGLGVLTSYLNKNEPSSIEQPIYEFLTPLFDTLYRNPEFQFKRNYYLYDYITNRLTNDYFKEIVSNWRKLIEPLFDIEKNASALIDAKVLLPMRLPVSAEYRKKDIDRLLEYYDLRIKFILKHFEDSVVNIYPINVNKIDGIKQYVLTVNGNSPVKYDLTKVGGKFFADFNMNKNISEDEVVKESSITFYPALKETTDFSNIQTEWLQIGKRIKKYTLVPTEQTYLIGIEEKQEKQILDNLVNLGKNAITNKQIKAKLYLNKEFDFDSIYSKTHSFHCWSKYEKN